MMTQLGGPFQIGRNQAEMTLKEVRIRGLRIRCKSKSKIFQEFLSDQSYFVSVVSDSYLSTVRAEGSIQPTLCGGIISLGEANISTIFSHIAA